MSTLTMALAAALLAGNAPESVSGETRQVLDFRQEWQGTYRSGQWEAHVHIVGRALWLQTEGGSGTVPIRLIDDGNGVIRIALNGRPFALGIYLWRKGRIVISFPCGPNLESRGTLTLRPPDLHK